MRLHRPAPVLVEHHEVLLPAVQSREQLLELAEAHLAREVPLVRMRLSLKRTCGRSDRKQAISLFFFLEGYVEHRDHDPARLQAEGCERQETMQ